MSERLPPGSCVIARGDGESLDAVMAIMDAAFDRRFGEAWTRAQCAGILPMSGVTLLVARIDGAIAGFSLSRRVADEAELLLIAVDPATAGRGIGGMLVDRFVADHRGTGAAHLHLEVRDGNPAVKLYENRGFTVAGRRAKYYRGVAGQQYDALTMVHSGATG